MMETIDFFILFFIFMIFIFQIILIAMLTTITKFFEFYINEKSHKYVFGDDQKHSNKLNHDGDSLFI